MAAPEDQAPRKKPLISRWLENVPFLRQFSPTAPGGMRHTGGLVDVFASFAALDNRVDRAEAEVALDLLRHAFPEADHGWLARRLHRALASPQPPERVAKSLRNELDTDDCVSLGLQLHLLVIASGSAYRGKEAFTKVMRSLNAEEIGTAIVEEMEGKRASAPLPFDKVHFGTSEDADVQLPSQGREFSFCAYRSKDLILIRNTGKEPVWISGSSLAGGQCIRLRPHQSIGLPDWTLAAEDISFFLNSARTGHRRTLYINESDNQLTAERVRSRQSTIRLDFGLNVRVEALVETEMKLSTGELLKPGTVYDLPAQDYILLANGTEASLEGLRKQAMEAGSRFRMDAGRQECLVSNDPAALKRGDVLLSPGLARRVVLKIKFDPQTATGHLHIISAERVVMVNGQPIRSRGKLVDGSLIRLSPNQAVRCRFSESLLDEERTVIRELNVESLNHKFGTDTVLDNVEFSVKRGEMLCIMGPSGSGKSTLLATLAGHLKPSRGYVRLNNVSLYHNRTRLAPFIASMPQEEALNPQLTVREHLKHASMIRRPHLGHAEHAKRVDSILAELALQPLARRRVGSPGDKTISGGERGRLNLGLDLGSPAEIFLFDEPISGLSSKDSEHVAETLHALSRDNIVIASLHRPGARVLRLFDKVLLLDKGGRVAFFGSPTAMGNYFSEASKEFNILTPKRLKAQQIGGADFVFDVLETPLHGMAGREGGGVRRFPPTFWQERFEGSQLVDDVARGDLPAQSQLGSVPLSEDHMAVPTRSKRQRIFEWERLFRTHFHRTMLSKFRNKGTIYSILLEAPLLALLIGITLRASPEGPYSFHSGLHLPVYIFLTVTIGMFLGLTNSATEILRDFPVLRRERNCRTGTILYVGAKFLALSIVAALQCAIYTWIGHEMLDIYGMFTTHWMWMTLTALCGTAMALVVSSLVTTERAALSAVPLLLVPQLLLAGALVSFDEMNRGMFQGAAKARAAGAEPFPARFMPLRYAYEGMIVSQATDNPFEHERRKVQRSIDPLKEVGEKRLAGDLTQELTPKQSERLNVLKESLRRLMAAESTDAESAKSLGWKLSNAGRNKTMDQLLEIPPYPEDESIETRPVRDFFVNNRTDLLVSKSEIDRVDYRQQFKRSIFLAEWKYWFGFTSKTTQACSWIIGGCIVFCLLLTTLFLHVRNHRTR
ncbi:ATP-binding cassette domain-containing protein [Oceaniferula spumae]|uniref:ATP-binding cassette domain-containing protein n=1 Tax=Oceaniferula spumae TaxID=2979115 RepID=UPI003F4EFB42